jgi:hypothetical protein
MKKIREDKPIGFIIHRYIEIPKGNSSCSYFYLRLKCHVFHFIFSLFPSTKSENRRAEQVLPSGEGWHQCELGGIGGRGYKSGYGAIKCVHM